MIAHKKMEEGWVMCFCDQWIIKSERRSTELPFCQSFVRVVGKEGKSWGLQLSGKKRVPGREGKTFSLSVTASFIISTFTVWCDIIRSPRNNGRQSHTSLALRFVFFFASFARCAMRIFRRLARYHVINIRFQHGTWFSLFVLVSKGHDWDIMERRIHIFSGRKIVGGKRSDQGIFTTPGYRLFS